EGLKGQEELDAFLERFAGDPAKRRVLLIHHLPDSDQDSCQNRQDWERSKQKAGVLFGRPELVRHALFDSVVEYREDRSAFASQLKAAALDGPSGKREIDFECPTPDPEKKKGEEKENIAAPSRHEVELKPINFFGTADNVHVCPLDSVDDVQQCADFLR